MGCTPDDRCLSFDEDDGLGSNITLKVEELVFGVNQKIHKNATKDTTIRYFDFRAKAYFGTMLELGDDNVAAYLVMRNTDTNTACTWEIMASAQTGQRFYIPGKSNETNTNVPQEENTNCIVYNVSPPSVQTELSIYKCSHCTKSRYESLSDIQANCEKTKSSNETYSFTEVVSEFLVSGTMALFEYDNNILNDTTIEIIDNSNQNKTLEIGEVYNRSDLSNFTICDPLPEGNITKCLEEGLPKELIAGETSAAALTLKTPDPDFSYELYEMTATCSVYYDDSADVTSAACDACNYSTFVPRVHEEAFVSHLTIPESEEIMQNCNETYCLVGCSVDINLISDVSGRRLLAAAPTDRLISIDSQTYSFQLSSRRRSDNSFSIDAKKDDDVQLARDALNAPFIYTGIGAVAIISVAAFAVVMLRRRKREMEIGFKVSRVVPVANPQQ
jgi:hypothetical protein